MVTLQMTRDQFVATPIAVSEFRNNPAVSAFDSVNAIGVNQINKQGVDAMLIAGLNNLIAGKTPATRLHEGGNPSAKEPMIFGAEATRKVMRETTFKASKYAVLDFEE